jgi:hypothetical protein
MPRSFNQPVHVAGLPAEVKTILTPISTMMFMCSSILGYNKGTFTPNGLSVAALHLAICSRKTSGYIDPAPNKPKPPALLTAEANSQPLHQIIPA